MATSPDQLTKIANPRYSFTEIKTNELIDSAFRLIGVDLAQISDDKSYEAIKSLNEILIEWISQGILQFNEKRFFIPLVNNKAAYNLPESVYDIYTVLKANFARLIGTPYGIDLEGGFAEQVFGYGFSSAVIVKTTSILGTELELVNGTYPLCSGVGLSMHVDRPVAFKVYGSNFPVLSIEQLQYADVVYDSVRPVYFDKQISLDSVVWFSITAPTPYQFLFVVFNDRSIVRSIYFLQYQQSQKIGIIGRESMMSITKQAQINNTSSCAIEKNNKHITVRLMGTASQVPANYDFPNQFASPNFLYLEGVELPFSVNFLQTTIDIHYRFSGALKAYLAFELAKQYAPDKVQFLGSEANRKFMLALNDNKDLQSIQINLPNSRTWS